MFVVFINLLVFFKNKFNLYIKSLNYIYIYIYLVEERSIQNYLTEGLVTVCDDTVVWQVESKEMGRKARWRKARIRRHSRQSGFAQRRLCAADTPRTSIRILNFLTTGEARRISQRTVLRFPVDRARVVLAFPFPPPFIRDSK